MKEISFFNKNEKNWEEIDRLLSKTDKVSADKLSEYYIRLTDDLAFAQTNYPLGNTIPYLNLLVSKIHQRIYRNKKKKTSQISNFFVQTFPMLIYKYRVPLLVSLAIIILSWLIGAFSTYMDERFPRMILGDNYVDMTLQNIEKGNPLGVYENKSALWMFLEITVNNIKVSFVVFSVGIICSVFSGFILFKNGIMLGCFQYFFYAKNLFYISTLTIWVHGTLEIASIVIAGGAGIAMGNSFMFPSTYSRLHSFQEAAKESVKILAGLIPLFFVAGFLEGYVTRHSHINTIPAAIIITLSVTFLLFYFIYYPLKLNNHAKNQL